MSGDAADRTADDGRPARLVDILDDDWGTVDQFYTNNRLIDDDGVEYVIVRRDDLAGFLDIVHRTHDDITGTLDKYLDAFGRLVHGDVRDPG